MSDHYWKPQKRRQLQLRKPGYRQSVKLFKRNFIFHLFYFPPNIDYRWNLILDSWSTTQFCGIYRERDSNTYKVKCLWSHTLKKSKTYDIGSL